MKCNHDRNSKMLQTTQGKRDSEEIIRQLEQFPVEVLEAALLVLQMREAKPRE
jgi:hypothetical protein